MKKVLTLRYALFIAYRLFTQIFDGLEKVGSKNPEEDLIAFVKDEHDESLGKLILGSMLESVYSTTLPSTLHSYIHVMKAKRDLSYEEVLKIAAYGHYSVVRSFIKREMEALDKALTALPDCKVTLLHDNPSTKGEVPIVQGGHRKVVGWRNPKNGIKKGERIPLRKDIF